MIYFYLGIVLALSFVCFIMYGWDKRSAGRGDRRVPEKTLHLLAFLGGWPGAILGQQYFRHKTKKFSFQLVFWLLVVLHLVLLGLTSYLINGSVARIKL